ncbi:hypothetical protein M758_10G039700 [Ceratodon purpureus]|nr:hypothetical protein M758_10G039700 [Ceratodon purpureus]
MMNELGVWQVSYVDLLGVVRSKLVPSAAIGAMQKVGAGFAGYAAHFDMTAADPDMMAVPDAKSVIKLPWTEGVAWVASDVCMNGTPVLQSPRHVLRNQIEKAEKKGLRMKTGVECEFFLLTNGVETEIADVKDVASKPCYDQGALMRHFTVISELLEHMETLGWKPYQADHEDGNGQFELNWEYDDCLATADKHTFFKFMAKSVAEKHGFRATFMPKPFVNKTGNGAHCHVSVWNPDGSSNLFHDKDGELVQALPTHSVLFSSCLLWELYSISIRNDLSRNSTFQATLYQRSGRIQTKPADNQELHSTENFLIY